jgi:hypothetical protein
MRLCSCGDETHGDSQPMQSQKTNKRGGIDGKNSNHNICGGVLQLSKNEKLYQIKAYLKDGKSSDECGYQSEEIVGFAAAMDPSRR